jgi:hypothetical protein
MNLPIESRSEDEVSSTNSSDSPLSEPDDSFSELLSWQLNNFSPKSSLSTNPLKRRNDSYSFSFSFNLTLVLVRGRIIKSDSSTGLFYKMFSVWCGLVCLRVVTGILNFNTPLVGKVRKERERKSRLKKPLFITLASRRFFLEVRSSAELRSSVFEDPS